MAAADVDLVRQQIDTLCRRGAVDEALNICGEAIEKAGSLATRAALHCLKGDLLLQLGREADAIDELQQTARVARLAGPAARDVLVDVQYYLALASSDPAADPNLTAAIASLEALVGDGRRDPEILGRLAALYEARGRLREARSLYAEAAHKAPEGEISVHAHKALALISGRLDGYESGRRLFEQTSVMADRYPATLPNVLWEFGTFEWEHEHYADALHFLRAALEVLPNDPLLSRNREFLARIHWQVGRLYYADSKLAEARRHCERVLEAAATGSRYTGGAHLILGHCFAACGDTVKAAHHYRECLDNPATPDDERRLAMDGLQETGAAGRA